MSKFNAIELFDSQGYTVVTKGGGAALSFLKTAPEGSAMRRIYDGQLVHDGVEADDDELMRRVREEEKTLMWAAYRAGLRKWSPGCENFSGMLRQKW